MTSRHAIACFVAVALAATACGEEPLGLAVAIGAATPPPLAITEPAPPQEVPDDGPGVGGRLAMPPTELDGRAGILAAALAAARADHPRLDADAVRTAIARLSDRWRERVPEGATPRQRAQAFAGVLFEDEGFRSVTDLTSPETLHVDSVLTRKEGYCLSLSVVALAMAEQLGEPLYGVAMPNHFLVRWDDGETRFNLELTRRGAFVADEELRERMGDFHHAGSLYMQNLEAAEVSAVLLHNRGFVALVEGRAGRALADLTLAARLLPELPEVHRNLGVARGEAGDWPGAIEALETAVMLYPGDVDGLINLGLARHASGDLDGALEEIDAALMLHPGHPRAVALRQTWSAGHALLAGGARALDDPPPDLAKGLVGRYHRGTSFDRLVHTQVDRGLDFDWKRGSPARNVPSDRFSVRWDGWFKADRAGLYTLFVVANDGVRFRFGDTLAVDHWQDTGYSSWTGTGDVQLAAGWHPLRIEYYDRSDNARLVVMISRDGDEYPLEVDDHLYHTRE